MRLPKSFLQAMKETILKDTQLLAVIPKDMKAHENSLESKTGPGNQRDHPQMLEDVVVETEEKKPGEGAHGNLPLNDQGEGVAGFEQNVNERGSMESKVCKAETEDNGVQEYFETRINTAERDSGDKGDNDFVENSNKVHKSGLDDVTAPKQIEDQTDKSCLGVDKVKEATGLLKEAEAGIGFRGIENANNDKDIKAGISDHDNRDPIGSNLSFKKEAQILHDEAKSARSESKKDSGHQGNDVDGSFDKLDKESNENSLKGQSRDGIVEKFQNHNKNHSPMSEGNDFISGEIFQGKLDELDPSDNNQKILVRDSIDGILISKWKAMVDNKDSAKEMTEPANTGKDNIPESPVVSPRKCSSEKAIIRNDSNDSKVSDTTNSKESISKRRTRSASDQHTSKTLSILKGFFEALDRKKVQRQLSASKESHVLEKSTKLESSKTGEVLNAALGELPKQESVVSVSSRIESKLAANKEVERETSGEAVREGDFADIEPETGSKNLLDGGSGNDYPGDLAGKFLLREEERTEICVPTEARKAYGANNLRESFTGILGETSLLRKELAGPSEGKTGKENKLTAENYYNKEGIRADDDEMLLPRSSALVEKVKPRGGHSFKIENVQFDVRTSENLIPVVRTDLNAKKFHSEHGEDASGDAVFSITFKRSFDDDCDVKIQEKVENVDHHSAKRNSGENLGMTALEANAGLENHTNGRSDVLSKQDICTRNEDIAKNGNETEVHNATVDSLPRTQDVYLSHRMVEQISQDAIRVHEGRTGIPESKNFDEDDSNMPDSAGRTRNEKSMPSDSVMKTSLAEGSNSESRIQSYLIVSENPVGVQGGNLVENMRKDPQVEIKKRRQKVHGDGEKNAGNSRPEKIIPKPPHGRARGRPVSGR